MLGYHIDDPFVAYQCDQLCDNFGECLSKFNAPALKIVFGNMDGFDECERETMLETIPNFFIKHVEPLACSPGKFLFGDKLTIADFAIGGYYCNAFTNPDICFGTE